MTDPNWQRFRKLRLNFEEVLANKEQGGQPVRSRARIAAYLDGSAELSAATVALGNLAGYLSTVGCARVAKGEIDGFKDIDRACLFQASVVRVLARAYELDTRPQKPARIGMDTLADAYLHARAIGASQIVESLTSLVRAADEGSGAVGISRVQPLSTLVAWMVLGRAPGTAARWAPLGPYARVAAREHTPHEYDELARFHVREAARSNGELFQLSPLAEIPFELRAIEAWSGVPIESPTHPLLTSPLALKRSVPVIEPTEELKQVLAKASTELGTEFL